MQTGPDPEGGFAGGQTLNGGGTRAAGSGGIQEQCHGGGPVAMLLNFKH